MVTTYTTTCDRCGATVGYPQPRYGLTVETPYGERPAAPRYDLCRSCLDSLGRWLAGGQG